MLISNYSNQIWVWSDPKSAYARLKTKTIPLADFIEPENIDNFSGNDENRWRMSIDLIHIKRDSGGKPDTSFSLFQLLKQNYIRQVWQLHRYNTKRDLLIWKFKHNQNDLSDETHLMLKQTLLQQ